MNHFSVFAFAGLLLSFCSCQETASSSPAESRNWSCTYEALVIPDAQGTLFIIGGGSRPLDLMAGVVQRLPSKDALVIVLPMASSEPDTALYYGIKPLVELGCTNVHGMNLKAGAYGEAQLDSIRQAKGFYLCGGDQAQFMAVAQGPIQEAIQEAFRRGAIVSGSSAGAAMMSQVMITGDEQKEPEYEPTYSRIETNNAVYGEGLGLLQQAIIDQHFIERSRYNRALTALHDHPGLPVFGIGEATALVIEPGGISIEGAGQVVLFHPNSGKVNERDQIHFDNLRLDVFLAGDTLP